MKESAGLTYRSHYWDDRSAKGAFKEFLVSLFGLDLGLWDAGGFWDEQYMPFSLFDEDRIVSSVCLYSMEMTIGGKRRRVGQFSAVATLPSFRRRGLARRLTEKAVEWASDTHEGFFLFASDEAVPFYARCGFSPIRETADTLVIDPPPRRDGLRKLDMGSDRDIERVHEIASERAPVSDTLGALNPKLLMFHCLYALRDCVYEVADLDTVVLFKPERGRLVLFDVIGRRVPPFAELYPYLAREPHEEILFLFMTDKMGIEPTGKRTMKENNAHIDPAFPLPGPRCLFPYASRA
ncbi:MAG: GNAT family N-acetyltransferase [Candidatus Eisenbacteria bacterium]